MTDMVIPPAAREATSEAIFIHSAAGLPWGDSECGCGETFKTVVERQRHASEAVLAAALPHLRPLFETAKEAAERAVDFDGYMIQATVNGDVEVSCVHCPTIHRFEPSRTGLLEIFQTARNHMRNCPGRTVTGGAV